jgi:signal transduction histidine kinase
MDTTGRPAGAGAGPGEVGLGLGFALGLGGTALMISGSWGARYALLDAAAGAVVCLLAVLRRRDRLRAAVAGLAVAAVAVAVAALAGLPREPGPVTALALAVLQGAVIRTGPVRSAVAVGAGGLAVVLGAGLAVPARPGTMAVVVLAALAWLAGVAVGLWLRLADARSRSALERVRRDERLELARELHDQVTHHVTGIVVQAQAARLVGDRHPERLPGALAGIELAGSDALAAMRRVVGLLRDTGDAAPASAGPERLGELVDRFRRHGPPVRLTLPERPGPWPPEVTSTVHRIVQESLTNVARHAPHARSVTVTVGQDDAAVSVAVVDDAPPGPPRQQRGGYGLVGMRERVLALGGTLRVGPRPDGGWSVLATLPLGPGTTR